MLGSKYFGTIQTDDISFSLPCHRLSNAWCVQLKHNWFKIILRNSTCNCIYAIVFNIYYKFLFFLSFFKLWRSRNLSFYPIELQEVMSFLNEISYDFAFVYMHLFIEWRWHVQLYKVQVFDRLNYYNYNDALKWCKHVSNS